MRPSFRDYYIDDETDFIAEIIDTWNMKVRKAGIHKGKFRIELPARQFMAVRLRRPTEEDYLNPIDEEEVIEEEIIEEPEIVEEEFTAEDAAFEALETVDEEPAEEAAEETETDIVDELEEEEEDDIPEFDVDEPEEEAIDEEESAEEDEAEEPVEDNDVTEEIKTPYVYKHAAGEKFSENVDEDIPEYTVPQEEEAEQQVLVEEYPADNDDMDPEEELDLSEVEEAEPQFEELPDIVSGAIEKVSSYDDRTPDLDEDDVLDNLIDEAEKTLDIPIVGFKRD